MTCHVPLSAKAEYMVFISQPTKGKTGRWDVHSRNSGHLLGVIKWWGAWRQYCFFPEPNCVFNRGCLEDINNFIAARMQERKRAS